MGYTFSTDQQSIIDSRNQNILVSAAAGSGKTSVLTERIVRLVADENNKTDIDRILVVTFTNAAAREMKERIGARLNDMLAEQPDNVHLQKQAQLIYNAQITTIDSYCLYLLKNHFHRINVDPVFRVASEGEMKLLRNDVLAEVMKRAYASGDPDFYFIVDCYSKKDKDETLEKSIIKLYTYAMSYPKPEDWLKKCKDNYAFSDVEEFKKSVYVESLLEDIGIIAGKIEKLYEECGELIEDNPGLEGYRKSYVKDGGVILPFLDAVETGDYDKIRIAGCESFPSRSGKFDEADKEAADRYVYLRTLYADLYKNLAKGLLAGTLDEYYEDVTVSGRIVGKLADLAIDLYKSFSQAKRDRSVIDFSDMEHMAIDILTDKINPDNTYEISEVARDLRNYYAEVMVDEYQDSNLVQEIIIQSVSKENEASGQNRFMVGDVKQSIYRFRLARPDIFVGKSKRYIKDAAAADRLITLKQNYRSRDSVIDSVNAVFKNIMTADRGGIEYDDDARLTRAGSFTEDTKDNITEVILLNTDGMRKADFYPYEADALAMKIKNIVGNMKVYDRETEGLKPASYKDIAILFRSPAKWRSYIRDSFERAGIPYHMEGVGAFYEAREVREILDFLKVIDNPLEDIPLYASMISCFGNLTDEECAIIKAEDRGKHYYLWDKLKAYSEAHPDNEKVGRFLGFIGKYRKYVTYMPISELITTLFEETGYKYIVAALPDGKQRLANVNLLVLKATEYAKTSFHGLFHFMRYIELIKKAEQDEGEANVFDENADVVRIMSIHKSKGLEFPVCIVADVDREFNKSDYSSPFVSDMELGIGADYIDPVKRVKRTTIAKEVIINKMKRENLGEEIRVLYVALTRAKEKLIIMGGIKQAEEWETGFPPESENSYLGLIGRTIADFSDSLFDLHIESLAALETAEAIDEISRQITRGELEEGANDADKELFDRLKERLAFEYPFESLSRLYTKTSVSDLKLAHMEEDKEAKHVFEENEPHEYVPSFAGGEAEIKGTARGTAYHNMLQMIKFANISDCKNPGAEYDRQKQDIIASGRMSAEDVALVNDGKIVTFLKSDIAARMAEADRNGNLFKEQPFVIGIKASELEAEFPENETVLIQGVIDAFFIENGEVVLLDYKTDRVDSCEELVSRYQTQLDYYATAISSITGLNVKEKLIYSLRLNQSIILK